MDADYEIQLLPKCEVHTVLFPPGTYLGLHGIFTCSAVHVEVSAFNF